MLTPEELQDAPRNHLMPFRDRRDAPHDVDSHNQNQFDPGESFSKKSRVLSQLAMQVCGTNITREHKHKHTTEKSSSQTQSNLNRILFNLQPFNPI
jgi:hypothetical protein